jgi:hypothetical protein
MFDQLDFRMGKSVALGIERTTFEGDLLRSQRAGDER